MILWQHSCVSVMLNASTIVRPYYHVLDVSMHLWMVVSRLQFNSYYGYSTGLIAVKLRWEHGHRLGLIAVEELLEVGVGW